MIRYALLVLAIACGGGSTSSPPPEPAPAPKQRSAYEELEARIPTLIAAFDQLAKDLTAVKEDCPKIAAALRKWGSQYAVELDAMWQLKQKLTPEERERYEHEHDEDAKRLDPVFQTAMTGCEGDAEVKSALELAGFKRADAKRP